MVLNEELAKVGFSTEELETIKTFNVDEHSSLFDVFSQATIKHHPSVAIKIADFDKNMTNKYGWSLVHIAIRNDCMEAFDHLVSIGADLEVMDGVGWNPLMESIVDDKVAFAKKLVAKGVNTKVANQRGATAGALIQKFGRSDFYGLI